MTNLVHDLRNGTKRVGVWGLGYIGFSTAAHFAKEGIRCIGTDLSEDRVAAVNRGKATIPNLDYWLNFNTELLAEQGLLTGTLNWEELIQPDVMVHLITIPTERNGEPYHGILKDVIGKLSRFKDLTTDGPPLVIVESTLTPTAADELIIPLLREAGLEVGKDLLLGVAPRRDWFTAPDKSLTVLPRVVGGADQTTTDLMAGVLGIICQNVIKAPDHKHAALVKSIENAYRQVEIVFANQLSQAYPDLDMRRILELVGTKWNIGTFQPSFGTGGYCIPLAPQYVLQGAGCPEALSLLEASMKSDAAQPYKVVESLVARGVRRVGILGLTYTADLQVHILSPTIRLAQGLLAAGIEVKVHDPYYTAEEIGQIAETDAFEFPGDLSQFDTVLINSGHLLYRSCPDDVILSSIANCELLLDSPGIWSDITFSQRTRYYRTGGAGWLTS